MAYGIEDGEDLFTLSREINRSKQYKKIEKTEWND